jgi:putative ABC transport system permease protein
MKFRARTPLAWRNVTHKKVTLLVSSAAVAFAVLIMFMQLGFLNGLYDSQTGLMRHLRAELVLVSREQHTLVTRAFFPRSRLVQAAAVPGVGTVHPIYVEDRASLLRNPGDGRMSGIRVVGFDPAADLFDHPEIEALVPRLATPLHVLYDRRSRDFFGPVAEGTRTELGRREVTVAGVFGLGADYFYDGNVLASEDTFFRLFGHLHPERVTLGLVRLAPGADPAEVEMGLRRALEGTEVQVLTREGIMARERAAWRRATPAGYVFAMGVVVGFVIGVIICYQILYTDISDHLPQIATMKALGYQSGDLIALVLRQALLLGVLGFVPAVLLCLALYSALTALTGIVTVLTLGRAAFVLGLTLVMCVVSGLLAVRRALSADPAELF